MVVSDCGSGDGEDYINMLKEEPIIRFGWDKSTMTAQGSLGNQ